MQRDIAQLQDQVRTLQSGFDQKMAALQTLVQQALDAASKANTSVSVLGSGVTRRWNGNSAEVTPVAGLAAKVDNTNNDVAEVRNSVSDLNTQVNKILQVLNDLNAQVKVLQAPVAPPPGTAPGLPPGSAAGPPPVPASSLFDNAVRDQNGGKTDFALGEYSDFLRFYPNDPNGANAQFNIGEIHYAQNKLDQAVQDFDTVIERYPDNATLIPDAYFMKGMALKQSSRHSAAETTFRALIAKYPHSPKAEQAKEQLRAMGVNLTGAPSSKRKPH